MAKRSLFSYLVLRTSKDGRNWEIAYENNIWIHIRKGTTDKLFRDFATAKFIKMVSSWTTVNTDDPEIVKIASEMNTIYTSLKKDYHNNNHIQKYDTMSKEFKELMKAAKIVKQFGTDARTYVLAQIEELGFTKNFPQTNHLSGSKALDRFLNYKTKHSEDFKLKEETKKLYITKTDKETPVRENPKWLDIYDKMKEDEASYLEVKFIHDVQLLRSGRVSPEIKEALKDLKPKKKRKRKE